MKKAVVMVICVLMVLFGVACERKEETDDNNIVIGFSQLGSESGWRLGNTKSIQEAADKANVGLLFLNAEQKYENQIKHIRRLIANRVDIIAFSPIVNTGWDNVLREANDAGIPVIVTDRSIIVEDDNLYETFIGSDFEKEGERAAEFLIKYYGGNEQDVKIVELRGTEDSTPAIGRTEGFKNLIDEYDNYSIVYSENGDFMRSRGREIMQRVLDMEIEFDVIYSHNDAMTYGVIEILEERGIKPGIDVVIISVDGEQKMIDLLKEGKVNCVVECTPLIGDTIIEMSKKILNGEQVPKEIYSDETVFTMWDDLSDLDPRGY